MKNPYLQLKQEFANTTEALHNVGDIPGVTVPTLKCLTDNGLQPYHTLLDVGAGCFRMYTLIDYLNDGHYFAIEANKGLIEAGVVYLEEKGVTNTPKYHVTSTFETSPLGELFFDYILISGVVCHMEDEEIITMFDKLSKVVSPHTKIFVSFINSKIISIGWRGTHYDHLTTLIPSCYDIEHVPYNHPRGLQMIILTTKNVGETEPQNHESWINELLIEEQDDL